MEDPWFLHKRAFHYALEGDEFLCKVVLNDLDEGDSFDGMVLQDIAHAAQLLATWAQEVFGQTISGREDQ